MTSNGDEKATSAPPSQPAKPANVVEKGWNLVDSTPPAPVSEVPTEPPAPPPPSSQPSAQRGEGSAGTEV